jgi:predicted NUDIX family NTP pyrophosphohydrolase
MDRKVSAAVIIYDPVKQVILAEHPTGRRWYKKDTKEPETGVFSLPKGLIEEGEDPVESAIREIKEETDIDLDIKRLHYLGKYKYIKYKDLELFFYPLKEDEIDIKKCKCTSFFDGPNGKKLPEVNGFSWLHMETDLHFFFVSQQEIIKKIIEKYPKFFC